MDNDLKELLRAVREAIPLLAYLAGASEPDPDIDGALGPRMPKIYGDIKDALKKFPKE